MGGETRQSPTPAASGIQPRRIPRIEHWRTPLLDTIFSGLLDLSKEYSILDLARFRIIFGPPSQLAGGWGSL